MSELMTKFEEDGFAILPGLLTSELLQDIPERCDAELSSGPGRRDFLELDWIQDLARTLSCHAVLSTLLPGDAVAVQCTYFCKAESESWFAPANMDTSIPVQRKFSLPGWSDRIKKNGTQFTKPPREILENLIAIRIHFEDNTEDNGALLVVPGSHLDVPHSDERYLCEIPRGGALVMRPLLLHAPSKRRAGYRRVLYFLYGPTKLPEPAEWPDAV